MTTIQRTRQPGQGTRSGLMWLLYLCDAGLLVTSGLTGWLQLTQSGRIPPSVN